MPVKKPKAKAYVKYHRDGTVRARGKTIDGIARGYWE